MARGELQNLFVEDNILFVLNMYTLEHLSFKPMSYKA